MAFPEGSRRGSAQRPQWPADALACVSLGVGVPQVGAPDRMARLLGVRDSARTRAVLRAVGVRELLIGSGILSRWGRTGWLWLRVAGDAADLSLLGRALRDRRTDRNRVRTVMAVVAGVTALDIVAAITHSRTRRPVQGRSSITIRRPVEDVYRYWHDFENLPRFMSHLRSVELTGERRSHWRAAAPAGMTVEWDAEMVGDTVNEFIAWRSVGKPTVGHSGAVYFAPAPREQGTEVTVELEYTVPGGRFGAKAAKVFGEEPFQQIRDDLQRFKQVLETGEVVRSEGSPEGTNTRRLVTQRPAQPLP